MLTHLLAISVAAALVGPGLDRDAPQHHLIVPRVSPSRLLIGDYEGADYTLFAFTREWLSALTEMVSHAAAEGPVIVLIGPNESRPQAEFWLQVNELDTRGVRLVDAPIESAWVRDYGPLQVREASGAVRWLDGVYYEDRPGDDSVPSALAALDGETVEPIGVSIDGGGVISDGQGLCAMTFDSYALTETLDPSELAARLGCAALALVPELPDEPTGHVDLLAQFVGPGTVVVASADPRDRPALARRLDAAVAGLRAGAEYLGRRLNVVRVPLHVTLDGDYRSSVNGLRLRRSFLVPVYADSPLHVEEAAHAALAEAMPGVRIVPIGADEMIALAGAVHCVSMGLQRPTLGQLVARGKKPRRPRG